MFLIGKIETYVFWCDSLKCGAICLKRRKNIREPSSLRGRAINGPLELVHQQRGTLFPPPLVSDRVLDLNFVQDGTVIQLDRNRVTDGTFSRVMVVNAKALVFNTGDLGTECVNAWVRGGGVGAVVKWVAEG